MWESKSRIWSWNHISSKLGLINLLSIRHYWSLLTFVIDKNLLTKNMELFQAPISSIFQGLEKNRISIKRYIILSIYFPSFVVIIGDIRKIRIVKIMMKFQIIEHCLIEFLFGWDVLKIYKMIIDKEYSIIWINSLILSMKVLIIEDSRYDSCRIDSHIFIIEIICIKSREYLFMSMKYQTSNEIISYIFASLIRIINHDTNMYIFFFYSLMRWDIIYLYLINIRFSVMYRRNMWCNGHESCARDESCSGHWHCQQTDGIANKLMIAPVDWWQC